MKQLLIVFMFLFGLGCGQNTKDETSSSLQEISSEELIARMKTGEEIVLMDVRTSGEISEGIIRGASIFVDYTSGQLDQVLTGLDKNKTYVVYCRSGGRSSSAGDQMIRQGFTHVYSLSGGISQWQGEIIRR